MRGDVRSLTIRVMLCSLECRDDRSRRDMVTKKPTARPQRVRRTSRDVAPQLAIAAAALGSMVLMARALRDDDPPLIDRRARRVARSRPVRSMKRLLWPLFPLGLPGGYIAIAYATAHGLHRRGRRGGPAIVTSAWLGWLVHRAAKLVYTRRRPHRRGVKPRNDSYPSGHTTGATALALTTAYVLRRRRLISLPGAVALASIAPTVMGTYRVIDDEHWATDVVGGWLLGAAIALTCNAALADSSGGAARRIKASEATPRALHHRARPASPTSAAKADRGGSPGGRANIVRPSAR